jgi:hypothetical protein
LRSSWAKKKHPENKYKKMSTTLVSCSLNEPGKDPNSQKDGEAAHHRAKIENYPISDILIEQYVGLVLVSSP